MKLIQWAFMAALTTTAPAMAQDSKPAPGVAVQLNSLTPLDTGCRLTLMATNGLKRDLKKLVLETVLFNTSGAVERLTLFDLQSLPMGRPRVRQFDIAGLACENLGQMLVNGVSHCEGAAEAESESESGDDAVITANTCQNALRLSSRISVDVLG